MRYCENPNNFSFICYPIEIEIFNFFESLVRTLQGGAEKCDVVKLNFLNGTLGILFHCWIVLLFIRKICLTIDTFSGDSFRENDDHKL